MYACIHMNYVSSFNMRMPKINILLLLFFSMCALNYYYRTRKENKEREREKKDGLSSLLFSLSNNSKYLF